MTLVDFPSMAIATVACWSAGSALQIPARRSRAFAIASWLLMISGTAVLTWFLASYWIALERPPLRTLGETRLWYATFIPVIGFLVEYRYKIRWLKYYCMGLAALFLGINYMHPDVFQKALMPALQSVWFVPHVVVYLVAYALLAASAASGWHNVIQNLRHKRSEKGESMSHYLALLGFVLLTFGLIFGALWAKEAWGHYWTWDPKETWAFISWLAYLGYLHLVSMKTDSRKLQWYLGLAFIVLLFCWFGVNYLPSAQNSVHTYSG
ncbi:MAG TPA: cytochrome C assembly protein [Chlorobaculum parvum]|uniref:Cytochrome C assembly protein n=1 Tax=Chlorobaculum parvum TaxID=274539 RepID=A0A7C5DFT6_9CHLB|nr:cytochrome C assembly protein [Chlorobaculum parvum]